MSIQKSLKNAMLTGAGLVSWKNNTPPQYSGKRRQYFSPETRTFTNVMAQYSSDFVEAQMQGLDPADPFAWQTRLMRFSDVVKPNAAIQRHFDDYKMILIADRDIEYIVPGSKIVTMGSTWLVVNPENASGSDGCSLVRRCNAVWNYLDFYGNVVSEPLVVENFRANANDSDTQMSVYITKGYYNVICQYNDATRQIDTNTRFILGSGAYRVTGYGDFEMEFTGDYDSRRLLYFTIRYEEPNNAIDDMVNHVAGGKTFSWNISVTGPASMGVGTTAQFTASSYRNNVELDGIGVINKTLFAPKSWEVDGTDLGTDERAEVAGKTLLPNAPYITYKWESSDESVLTVDETGLVTAVAEGEAFVTAILMQNEAYSESAAVTVSSVADSVEFTTTPPTSLSYAETVTLDAAYFEDGVKTDEPVQWELAGGDESAYKAVEDGNSITITCYGYSAYPLFVEAVRGEYRARAVIMLEGI